MGDILRAYLSLRDCQEYLGLIEPSNPATTVGGSDRYIAFLGHSFREDGEDLHQYMAKNTDDPNLIHTGLYSLGYLDTHEQIDLIYARTGDYSSSRGLASLVARYKVGESRDPGYQARHNAGVDSAVNLEVQIFLAMDRYLQGDRLLKTWTPSQPVPFPFLNSVILMCVDTERKDNEKKDEEDFKGVTQFGFAWVDTLDLVGIAPGGDLEGWRPFFHYHHIKIEEYLDHVNTTAVDRLGFLYGWSEIVKEPELPLRLRTLFRTVAKLPGAELNVPKDGLPTLDPAWRRRKLKARAAEKAFYASE
ncbi:MAG: hypothetical protein Q9218_002875 [Villophora microphyllina]